MSCSSCKSCPSECATPCDETKIKYSTKINNDSLYTIPIPPKQKLDNSSLENICQHFQYGEVKRYQCNVCIREYVWAVSKEETEKQIEYYKSIKQNIAAKRIDQELKEYLSKQNVL